MKVFYEKFINVNSCICNRFIHWCDTGHRANVLLTASKIFLCRDYESWPLLQISQIIIMATINAKVIPRITFQKIDNPMPSFLFFLKSKSITFCWVPLSFIKTSFIKSRQWKRLVRSLIYEVPLGTGDSRGVMQIY